MFVCVLSPSHAIFLRPLICPQVTWSGCPSWWHQYPLSLTMASVLWKWKYTSRNVHHYESFFFLLQGHAHSCASGGAGAPGSSWSLRYFCCRLQEDEGCPTLFRCRFLMMLVDVLSVMIVSQSWKFYGFMSLIEFYWLCILIWVGFMSFFCRTLGISFCVCGCDEYKCM